MEIVKKNLVSILCGVVALIAIVAWFWPLSGMYADLQAQVDERGAAYKAVEELRTAPRKLPSLELETTEEQPALERFPNERVIAVGLEKTNQLKAQSDRMLATVSDLNVHEPLVPGSLPRANSQARSEFPIEYLNQLGITNELDAAWTTGLPLAMKATRPPTSDDILLVAEDIWKKEFDVQIFKIGQNDNYEQVSLAFQEKVVNLPEQERKKRAMEHLLYLDDGSLPASPDVQPGKSITDSQIWYAQNVLWIEQDVAAAIIAANAGAKNVLDAPVKHLVGLTVPFGVEQYKLPSQAPGMAGAAPDAAVLPVNANGVPEVYALSPTGRVSNDLYDVIHFELVLRVDFRKIPQILAELERNRLFTVLTTGLTTVDAAEELKQNGYFYGNDPVAEITLGCEALFLRSWTVDKENDYKAALMPELVQQLVGAKPPPAGTVMPGVPSEDMEIDGMDGMF